MSDDSGVGTHCSVFALSDTSDPDFRQQCNHDHNDRCLQWDAISATLADIEKLVSEATYLNDEDRDEALYLCHTAQRAIQAWKCHQLRSVRQDQGRLDVLDLLDDDTVFIVNDWAMKFLPQMY